MSQRPGIAIVVHSVRNGSVGAVAWRHAREFSRDHDVYVISADKNIPEIPGISHRSVNVPGFRYLRRLAHLPRELAFQRGAQKQLRRLCATVNLELIWCHSHGSVVFAARETRHPDRTRLVLTIHGDIFDRPEGTYGRVMTGYYRWVTPRAYAAADYIQALSADIADKVTQRNQTTGSIRIIPNGIDPGDIGLQHIEHRTRERFATGESLALLFVGDLLPVKRVDVILQAMAILHRGGTPVSLVCVGDGPEREALYALCRRLNIEQQVRFTGAVPRDNLAEYYRVADLLVIPSASDMLPTVVLEGFCAGLPAVGSRTGGIMSLLGAGRGWCFHPGDALDLAVILDQVAGDAVALVEASRRCSAAVAETYSWDSVMGNLRSWLDQT